MGTLPHTGLMLISTYHISRSASGGRGDERHGYEAARWLRDLYPCVRVLDWHQHVPHKNGTFGMLMRRDLENAASSITPGNHSKGANPYVS